MADKQLGALENEEPAFWLPVRLRTPAKYFTVTRFTLSAAGIASLALLALTFPFELEHRPLQLGPVQFTNVEVALGLVLILALIVSLSDRSRPGRGVIPRAWLVLGGLFVASMILAALLAPELNGNALKAAGRTLSGMLLVLATPQLVRSQRAFSWVTAGLLAGGLISVLLGFVEVWRGAGLEWLTVFRTAPSVAGPFIRLTGSFSHANQTAMFIEVILPLLIAIAWLNWRSRRQGAFLLVMILIVIFAQASIMTYSRSSFMTIFLTSLIIAGLLWSSRVAAKLRQARFWAAMAGMMALFVLGNIWLNPVFRLRLGSESDNEWYQVEFKVPETVEMLAGRISAIPVHITNRSAFTWMDSGRNPIKLGGRWYWLPGDYQMDERPQWRLGENVLPGDNISLQTPVRAPRWPGTYRFEWDLVQQDVVWFSQKNGLQTSTLVTVAPSLNAAGQPIRPTENIAGSLQEGPVYIPPIPARGALWRVAAERFLERPWLGIGLDNFRLTYGRAFDWEIWNDTIHSNNWYIETLVSLGLLGAIPFFLWLGLIVFDLVRTVRRPSGSVWQFALAAGLLAFLIHGLLDYFLLFNATGLLFWLLLGLWLSQKSLANRAE